MNDETVAALNAINRTFYRERASEFSTSRERGWAGWGELFDRLGGFLARNPAVLDVGCGNARFARFLDGRPELESKFTYWGVDASPLGLEESRKRFGARENVRFFEHDFVTADTALPAALSGHRFDLIVLFGILHHVPGRRTRFGLLEKLSESLAPGGLLAYTLWRFDRYERFTRKLVPWEEFVARTASKIDLAELEGGDSIMTWGNGRDAFRYCHAVSDEEEASLATFLCSNNVGVVAQFAVRNEPNRYWLLRNLMKEAPLDGRETPERETRARFE